MHLYGGSRSACQSEASLKVQYAGTMHYIIMVYYFVIVDEKYGQVKPGQVNLRTSETPDKWEDTATPSFPEELSLIVPSDNHGHSYNFILSFLLLPLLFCYCLCQLSCFIGVHVQSLPCPSRLSFMRLEDTIYSEVHGRIQGCKTSYDNLWRVLIARVTYFVTSICYHSRTCSF